MGLGQPDSLTHLWPLRICILGYFLFSHGIHSLFRGLVMFCLSYETVIKVLFIAQEAYLNRFTILDQRSGHENMLK